MLGKKTMEGKILKETVEITRKKWIARPYAQSDGPAAGLSQAALPMVRELGLLLPKAPKRRESGGV